MHITGLRLLGFKSFVDPTELIIADGLTGVVGPNGCGKSNLLEALKWVMGETSYKTMRASAMDDVIFSGTQHRPSRNSAEVTMFLDNSARTAPAGFNDSDVLEVTRRIERDAGSAYKINGNDVRARDVQLLFADASTGARSPALVQQGQIGQIVNSKPQARRRILEEAAGITGLYSRRHEAELRLKAAESNLERLQDIMGQLGTRLNSLKRQARQAKRYKELSTQIQQTEAIAYHLNWVAIGEAVNAEESTLQEILKEVGLQTQAEAAALRSQSETADELQPMRDEEATRAAILHRLKIEQENLDKEEERANQRKQELTNQLQALQNDLMREQSLIEEGRETLSRLEQEHATLQEQIEGSADEENEARELMEAAEETLAEAEEALSNLTGETAEKRATHKQLEQTVLDQSKLLYRYEEQQQKVADQYASLDSAVSEQEKIAELAISVEQLAELVSNMERRVIDSEQAHNDIRAREKEIREQANSSKLKSRQLETEVRTLEKLLITAPVGEWPPVVDLVNVAPGYEMALGTALGDDLDAPTDMNAPVHWRTVNGQADPRLPEGVTPLSQFVRAPEQLKRRLAQVGVVMPELGRQMQARLAPGQRLVSTKGDLWRWDGYSAASEAPTAAAKRLEEKNRLESVQEQMLHAQQESAGLELEQSELAEALRYAQDDEKKQRNEWRQMQSQLENARAGLTKAERANQENSRKLAALAETRAHIQESLEDARERKELAEAQLDAFESITDLEAQMQDMQARVSEKRAIFSDARATTMGIERETRQRNERLQTITQEKDRWVKRADTAEDQLESLYQRLEAVKEEHEGMQDLPSAIAEQREKLLNEITKAETARKEAADNLANAENSLNATGQSLRDIQIKLVKAKEERARTEARLEAAREKRTEHSRQIRDALSCSPDECLKLAGLEEGEALPDIGEIENRLQKLKTDRERLGGVNLRAEDEANELEDQFGGMTKEREDLEQAIVRLRQGISSLNREGRKRLLEAFELVNNHFRRLFTTLFGGGEAELKLIESDDPLEAGLEIIAKPPGKKPQVLTLLSGGEKALTAMSLIFAVFLTNPSPICVLDEVDAPLDDSNVNRFCTLLEEMVKNTNTRFLTITHHPMTMARMNRLFGVTMAEKGVSQLVSVDLATAENFREAS